ncbi:Uncharacterised protein [Vibrio cholerae]|uniref:Uncharacterized protein n=1 Tax=Vibrio cholerae TaxID=666 RepID=A0A655URW1_VIBCL|nr:Uncharacterised protein [Vibrio cholerae]
MSEIKTGKFYFHRFINHQWTLAVDHHLLLFHQRHHDVREVHARKLHIAGHHMLNKSRVAVDFTFT